MDRQSPAGPRPAPSGRPPGLGSLIAHFFAETKSLVTDYVELAVLDARRAAVNLAWLLGCVLIVAVLVITAWMGLVAALIVWMFAEGVSWQVAIGIAAVLNLAAAGGLYFWMRHLLADLPFTALLRQLRGEDPPPEPEKSAAPTGAAS